MNTVVGALTLRSIQILVPRLSSVASDYGSQCDVDGPRHRDLRSLCVRHDVVTEPFERLSVTPGQV